jgi:hypothetical protein
LALSRLSSANQADLHGPVETSPCYERDDRRPLVVGSPAGPGLAVQAAPRI